MRIGIDITPLPPNPVGAGTYMIQLVRAISKLPSEHQFVLIAQPKGRRLVGEISNPNVTWAMTPERSPALRLLWEQIGLPVLVSQLKSRCPSFITLYSPIFSTKQVCRHFP